MSFAKLGLAKPLLDALEHLGYSKPTPVQEKAIPAILAGRDVLAAAQTGTGKTAGFALPILHRLAEHPKAPSEGSIRALVLVPTRELAEQVMEAFRKYGAHLEQDVYAAYGGVPIGPQAKRLQQGVAVLVATPGRLIDLFTQRAITLRHVETVVLDEADRMLDLGFANDLQTVFAATPRQRQTLLFSATFSDAIRQLAGQRLKKPLNIEAAPRNTAAKAVKQWVVPVDKKRKADLFLFMRQDRGWQQVLVFCKTKAGCDELVARLHSKQIPADAIHGDRPQASRLKALEAFKAGQIDILVATDVAARGIDIDGLPQVVNFDLPLAAEDYIHRIGRTGRAGASGEAISFVCADEAPLLAAIESLLKKPLSRDEEPGFEPRHNVPSTASGAARPAPRAVKPGPRSNRNAPGNWVGFDDGAKSNSRRSSPRPTTTRKSGPAAGNPKKGPKSK